MTPLDRGQQRLLAPQPRAASLREEPKAIVEARNDLSHVECSDQTRGHLDGQRDSVQTARQLRDQVELFVGGLELGIVRRGSIHEELNRLGRSRSISVDPSVETWDTSDDLAGDSQRLPSCDQNRQ